MDWNEVGEDGLLIAIGELGLIRQAVQSMATSNGYDGND